MLPAILLGSMIFAGAAAGLRALLFVWQTARESSSWPSAEARFERKRIACPGVGWLLPVLRAMGHHPSLRFRYEVGGKELVCRRIAFGFPRKSDMRRIRAPLFHGEIVTIYYDPEDPQRASLIAGPVSERLMVRMVLLSALMMAAGAVLAAIGFLL